MDEYINKVSFNYAIREAVKKYPNSFYNGLEVARQIAHDFPAADVRPVVLCRNCKYTKTDGMDDPAIYCEKWDRWEIPPDGFCWLGEKSEE